MQGTTRRTATLAGAWSIPVIIAAALSPAYATSPHDPHVCDIKRCRPTAKRRRIKHPSGSLRWETKVTKTCEWSAIHSDQFILSRVPLHVIDVVWVPFPRHGANPKARVDAIHVSPPSSEDDGKYCDE